MAVKIYLSLESVALAPHGKTVSLSLGPGDRLAVVGRAGSGIEEFVAVAAKKLAPPVGIATHHGKVTLASAVSMGARATPSSLAKSDGTTRAAGVLGSLGLWDDRSTPCNRLGWRKIAACRLIAPLMARDGLWVIDGELDAVDPRVCHDFCAQMTEEAERRKAVVVATSSPTVVERVGSVLVLRNGGAVFAGPVDELVRASHPTEVVVETSNPGAVATMSDPFALRVEVGQGLTRITTHDGQSLAAKLVTEGYGSVRAVLVRQPDVFQSLLELL